MRWDGLLMSLRADGRVEETDCMGEDEGSIRVVDDESLKAGEGTRWQVWDDWRRAEIGNVCTDHEGRIGPGWDGRVGGLGDREASCLASDGCIVHRYRLETERCVAAAWRMHRAEVVMWPRRVSCASVESGIMDGWDGWVAHAAVGAVQLSGRRRFLCM